MNKDRSNFHSDSSLLTSELAIPYKVPRLQDEGIVAIVAVRGGRAGPERFGCGGSAPGQGTQDGEEEFHGMVISDSVGLHGQKRVHVSTGVCVVLGMQQHM